MAASSARDEINPCATSLWPVVGATSMPISSQWVINTGNAALDPSSPFAGGTRGCPWLGDGDLQAIWKRLTSVPFPTSTVTGEWGDHRPNQGNCSVGADPAESILDASVLVLSPTQLPAAVQQTKINGELYPSVFSKRENFGTGSGRKSGTGRSASRDRRLRND